MDYIEWTIIEDHFDWEEYGGQPADLPDEFPVLATAVAGYTITVNYDTAKILVDVYEDNSPHIEFVLDSDDEETN